jgi:hypothetical protein
VRVAGAAELQHRCTLHASRWLVAAHHQRGAGALKVLQGGQRLLQANLLPVFTGVEASKQAAMRSEKLVCAPGWLRAH